MKKITWSFYFELIGKRVKISPRIEKIFLHIVGIFEPILWLSHCLPTLLLLKKFFSDFCGYSHFNQIFRFRRIIFPHSNSFLYEKSNIQGRRRLRSNKGEQSNFISFNRSKIFFPYSKIYDNFLPDDLRSCLPLSNNQLHFQRSNRGF